MWQWPELRMWDVFGMFHGHHRVCQPGHRQQSEARMQATWAQRKVQPDTSSEADASQ